MSSFYGGKRGASLEIKYTSDTYQAMIDDKDNVDYNEYVIVKKVSITNEDGTPLEPSKYNVLYRRVQDGYNSTGYQEITELTIKNVISDSSTNPGEDNNTSAVTVKSATIIDSFSALKAAYDGKDGYEYVEKSFLLADCVAPKKIVENNLGNAVNVKYNYCTVPIEKDGEIISYETHIGFQLPYQEVELKPGNNVTIEKNDEDPNKVTWTISATGGSGGGSNAANVVYLQNLRVVEVDEISDDAVLKNPIDNSIIQGKDNLDAWKQGRTSVILYDQYADGEITTFYFGDYNSIKDFGVSQENGTFSVTDIKGNVQTYYFTDIQDISFENGYLAISYKNRTEGNPQTIKLKYVEDITFDSSTQKYTLHYSTKEESELDIEVNLIEEVVVTEDKHLLIYYSSPSYRNKYPDSTVTYQGKEGWIDYGIVSSDNGLYIGMNISPDDILGPNDYTLKRSKAIQFLNTNYADGLTGDNIAGKTVTIGYKEDPKDLYAFDYNKKSWYFLGSFGQNKGSGGSDSSGDITNMGATNFFGDISLSLNSEVVQSLPNGCTWFITEEM